MKYYFKDEEMNVCDKCEYKEGNPCKNLRLCLRTLRLICLMDSLKKSGRGGYIIYKDGEADE